MHVQTNATELQGLMMLMMKTQFLKKRYVVEMLGSGDEF